jgi:hypothetical protein
MIRFLAWVALLAAVNTHDDKAYWARIGLAAVIALLAIADEIHESRKP